MQRSSVIMELRFLTKLALVFPPIMFLKIFAPNSSMGLLGSYPYEMLATIFLGYLLFRQWKHGRNSNPKGLPLPPGPKGYPLIGNLFDLPVTKPWLVYDEWFKTYGDMIHFHVLGQHFLVLDSVRRTTDLFEKRSSNYSDRMRMTMVMDLMKWDFTLAFQPYGVWWRRQRRLFHAHFHQNAVSKYIPIQKREALTFLRRLLVTPDDFLHHSRHVFSATVMKIAYGIDVQETDDPYISLAKESLHGLNQAAAPGTFWVDLFPILKYVPSWFPGAGFQRKAAYWREVNAAMVEKPFRYVKEQLKNGKAAPSITATFIERLPDEDDSQRPIKEKLAKEVAASIYTGGADTTASTVQALFLAMALYPDVQKKAQEEIDAVVGPNRLPDFEDRPSLPYINAIVKESMRWHLVAPLSIPHMSTNDDEYDGYHIPKGTILIGCSWSMLHDPKHFKNPMEYQPERFLKDGKLNPDVMDPESVVFGFGRRICPGRYFSNNSPYIIASCLLAVYEIKPPVDDQGNIIQVKAEFSDGVLVFPAPFKCIIKPRTPAAEVLIRGTQLNLIEDS